MDNIKFYIEAIFNNYSKMKFSIQKAITAILNN